MGARPPAIPSPATPPPPIKVAAQPAVATVTNNPATMRSAGTSFRRGLTPQQLRRQIIINEILQPPVSLRGSID